jgi:Ni,Fe-hydrogenase I large subunit
MTTIISDLKTNKLDKYKELISNKLQEKKELQTRVDNLMKTLQLYKNKIRYWNKENHKILKQINQIKNYTDVSDLILFNVVYWCYRDIKMKISI